jgi:hypothetical protein
MEPSADVGEAVGRSRALTGAFAPREDDARGGDGEQNFNWQIMFRLHALVLQILFGPASYGEQ